jgi:hypothetical protein
MRRPAPLPAHLRGTPFRTRDAAVHDRRLRAPDVRHPFRGIAAVEADLASLRGRCRAYLLRMEPGQLFSHVTALALHGAPLPSRFEAEIHVSVAFPRTPPRTVGAIGHSLRHLEPSMAGGLPASSPAAAWCEAATLLTSAELIAAGDALLTGARKDGVRGPSTASVGELRAAATIRMRSPGAGRILDALPWIRTGVDSAAETALRLALIRWGLPEPETDHPIPVSGRVLHADLAYPAARVVLEYEGDVHRVDRTTWMRDLRRRELMEDAGWRVIRITADDLRDPRALITRLRILLGLAG